MAKKILFIVYYFPPLSGAGVQRPLKFVKYLPDFDWMPVVLTTTGDSSYEYRDYSLLQEIPDEIFIERVADKLDILAGSLARLPGLIFILEKLRGRKSEDYRRAIRNHLLRIKFFEFPDSQLVWAISAYFSGIKLIKEHSIDIIYSTSAPFSSHLIGFWLKRATGIPWVADFRDEWSQNPLLSTPTRFHNALIKKVERQIVNYADRVISVSEPIVQLFRNLSGDPHKFSTITNGYDINDFNIAKMNVCVKKDGKFYITYVGSFYEYPILFFRAVESLLSNGDIPSEQFRIKLVGKYSDPFRFQNPAWMDVIKYTGYLSHQEAITELLQSNALLLVIPNQRGAQAFTGKIFEYIASGKPIVAMIPHDSVAAELILRTKTGWVVPTDDISAIKSVLLELYKRWKSGNLYIEPDNEIIKQYERHHLSHNLAKILDEVVNNSL